MDGEIFVMKAQKLLALKNAQLLDDGKAPFKFLSGWKAQLKKFHGIQLRRVRGEEKSADNGAIKEHMPRVHKTSTMYADKNVSNSNEFGLLYHQPPSWSFLNKVLPGFKREKHRITFFSVL